MTCHVREISVTRCVKEIIWAKREDPYTCIQNGLRSTIGTDIRLSTKNSKSAVCENANNTGHYLLWDEV